MAAPNAVKDAKALNYRARGWTYHQIAAEMGYHDRSAARKAVERAIASDVRESNEAAKSILLTDLNAAKREIWAVMKARHVTISNGVVVRLDGEPVPDDDPIYRGVDRLIKIDQEIAKILGAYAPEKHEHEHRTIGEIDARLIELADEMAAVGTGDASPVPREA